MRCRVVAAWRWRPINLWTMRLTNRRLIDVGFGGGRRRPWSAVEFDGG
jgi:hypothetical protein